MLSPKFICDKHDRIKELSKEILSGKLTLDECITNANEIYKLASDANEDAIKMERALKEKKYLISSLTCDLELLKCKIENDLN